MMADELLVVVVLIALLWVAVTELAPTRRL